MVAARAEQRGENENQQRDRAVDQPQRRRAGIRRQRRHGPSHDGSGR
jgi:hypothetical protein